MNRKYTGDEHITFEQMPTGKLLSDFWNWMTDDLLRDDVLIVYAKYIVSTALDADAKMPVVLCSSYIKSRQIHSQLAAPMFGLPDADSNPIIVCCLLDCLNRDAIDPLKLEQWKFYIFRRCNAKQPILTVDDVKELSDGVAYDRLRNAVTEA